MPAKPNRPADQEPDRAEDVPFARPMSVFGLSRTKPTRLDLRTNADEPDQIAAFLGILAVRDLRLKGEIRPAGKEDWEIAGRLTAIAVQECVVTLDPVEQKISEKILRRYLPAEDVEPSDTVDLDPDAADDPDVLGDTLDPGALALEVLALALDPYPRAADATLERVQAAPPGVVPLDDEALKPFAGLAELKAKLSEEKG